MKLSIPFLLCPSENEDYDKRTPHEWGKQTLNELFGNNCGLISALRILVQFKPAKHKLGCLSQLVKQNLKFWLQNLKVQKSSNLVLFEPIGN